MNLEVETEKKYSADEVRNLLQADNTEIYNLCKRGNISLKRDRGTGRTFFLSNDVEVLQQLKGLHQKTEAIAAKIQKAPVAQPKKAEMTAMEPISRAELVSKTENALLMSAMAEIRDNIVTQITSALDEKLEGMDEVVVELINSKTENERLKQKLDALTKENFRIKKELESYRHLKFGVYVKI